MKALSHRQVAATISTGGAAKDVSVPPIETLTNRTPSAQVLQPLGHVGRNTSGASISAAMVIAAGSVTSEPSSGTAARQSQAVGEPASQRQRAARAQRRPRHGRQHGPRGRHHHHDEDEQRLGVVARLGIAERGVAARQRAPWRAPARWPRSRTRPRLRRAGGTARRGAGSGATAARAAWRRTCGRGRERRCRGRRARGRDRAPTPSGRRPHAGTGYAPSSWPPSTMSTCPVIQRAPREARNSATSATSSALPKRPKGMLFRVRS